MAAFAQILVLPLLLASATGYPHPYPWLQATIQNQPQYYESYPYSPLGLQNNPFLSGLFQNLATLVPDASFILGQLPFNIHGHPTYVNNPYFTGYKPEDLDWDKVPEVPYDGDLVNDGGSKPDDGQNGNNWGENGDSMDQGTPNSLPGYDEDPKVNENQIGADGSRPQEADENLFIDPRKDEAKYDKPH